jgi:parvulin-like peptidyl-prolyl isomerase
MTFRARPTSNRPRTWDDRDRRTFLMNVGFGLTVIVALLLLALAVGIAWYGDHLAAAATVNGQTITKDDYQKQLAINNFRIDYQTRRIRTLLTAGQIRTSDAQARLSLLDQRKQQAGTISLEQLIDGTVMQQLLTKEGTTVTEADVDAHVTEEATTPELRHAWMIAVEPTLAAGESVPTDAEKAAAKAKADQALADLKAGADWDTVAKSVSTDATKDQAGDLGFIDKNASLDLDFTAALMAAAKDAPTAVIEGADGTYRIGRVTEIVAASVDATLQEQVQAEGIGWNDYRAALRLEVVRTKLSDAVLAQYMAAGPQREVQEIWMQESASETGPSAIRVRHILYSPNGDPANASKVPADDPAWADAKVKAEATYQKLQADPSLFDSIARAESDEGAARTTGGKLPYFSTDDAIDAAFAAAVFAPGLQPGLLLAPVQSAFGWHVIQVMHGPTDMEWANKLKLAAQGGQDFGTLARDNSDKDNAAKGGDMGWVTKGVLSQELEDAIYATPVGSIGDPVKVAGDGVYLFKVNKEEVRTPDAEQKQTLETSAFSTWYTQQKAAFTITRDSTITTASG